MERLLRARLVSATVPFEHANYDIAWRRDGDRLVMTSTFEATYSDFGSFVRALAVRAVVTPMFKRRKRVTDVFEEYREGGMYGLRLVSSDARPFDAPSHKVFWLTIDTRGTTYIITMTHGSEQFVFECDADQ